MKKIVSFSGGRTSAYLCYLMKNLYGSDVEFVFMDTGAEHPKTYDFIKKVNNYFDLNLTCLRVVVNPELGGANSYKVISINEICADLQPWRDMMAKYGTPYNPGGAFCTDRMKLVPYKKYCDQKYGKNNYTTYLGIRADEKRRIKEKENIIYLAELSDFTKDDILEWWSEQPFDLEIEEHLGNCVFCIKKGINKVALAARDEPELAAQFKAALDDPSVRVLETRTTKPLEMYRGHNSFGSIIQLFSDHSRNEIFDTMRKRKQFDTNSCSESCELFQFELF